MNDISGSNVSVQRDQTGKTSALQQAERGRFAPALETAEHHLLNNDDIIQIKGFGSGH